MNQNRGTPENEGHGREFHAVIPFRPANPKTRLSAVLTQEERESFADAMLSDVVSAVRETGAPVTLLSTAPYTCAGAETLIRNEGLNEALNWILPQYNTPVLIIMSDLPLVTKDTIQRVVSTGNDVAIVPGLGGGTNILFIRCPEKYSVQYYGYSFMKHAEEAKHLGMSVEIIDSMRMSLDVDEPADLTELLIHGSGSAKRWLEEHGFVLSAESGRVSVKRGGKEIV